VRLPFLTRWSLDDDVLHAIVGKYIMGCGTSTCDLQHNLNEVRGLHSNCSTEQERIHIVTLPQNMDTPNVLYRGYYNTH